MPGDSGSPSNRLLADRIVARAAGPFWLLAAAGLGVTLAAIALAVVYVVLPAQRRNLVAETWVERTHEVIIAIDGILAGAADAETGQRGFLLTGDAGYLAPYDDGTGTIWHRFADLQQLTLDNPNQQARLALLHDQLQDKLTVLARTIELARGGDPKAALDMVRSGQGKALMDAIRGTIATMDAEEQRLLLARRADYETTRQASNGLVLMLGIFGGAGILVCGGAIAAAVVATRANRRAALAAGARLRLLDTLDLAPIMIRDLDGTIRFWSEGCRRLYGWTADQAIGRLARELLQTVFPGPPDRIDAELRQNREWRGELRSRTQAGAEVVTLAHDFLDAGIDGRGPSVMQTVADVTELRRMEAELHYSEDRLRLVQKVSGIAHCDRALSDEAAVISDEFTRMFGLPPGQTRITPAEFSALVHPDDRERVAAMLPRTLAQGGKFTGEFRVCLPGGELRWISTQTEIFPGPDGQSARAIVALQDITELVAAREVLAARHDELERSNAELEQFAYTVSHDLKAPLRAIGNLAQWIGEDIKPIATPETIDNLELLHGRVARMQKLMAGLLDYSRAGQLDRSVDDIDVADMVANIVAMQAPPPGFTIGCEGEALTLRTHPVALQVVLENLIGNSLKHHDRDAGRITVRGRRLDGLVEFRVSDDGPGIPEQFQRRIFEIFQTLHNRDDRETSGIGLAIVKRKVESHGGRIRVESAPPARGASFVFTWGEAAA